MPVPALDDPRYVPPVAVNELEDFVQALRRLQKQQASEGSTFESVNLMSSVGALVRLYPYNSDRIHALLTRWRCFLRSISNPKWENGIRPGRKDRALLSTSSTLRAIAQCPLHNDGEHYWFDPEQFSLLARSEAPPDSTPRLSVVIVDDHKEWRQIITRIIQPAYDVLDHVERGDEVLACVCRLRPDIITLDVSMPRLSGLNALPDIRAALPQAVIVIVSTKVTPLYRSEAILRGADAYVAKSLAGADLLPSIASALIQRANHNQLPA